MISSSYSGYMSNTGGDLASSAIAESRKAFSALTSHSGSARTSSAISNCGSTVSLSPPGGFLRAAGLDLRLGVVVRAVPRVHALRPGFDPRVAALEVGVQLPDLVVDVPADRVVIHHALPTVELLLGEPGEQAR